MDSSNASTINGVYLPNFPLATGDLLRAIEHSGSVTPTSRNDAGEYFSMAMATTKLAEEVMESAIIVIPLTVSRVGEVLDFSFVAASVLSATSDSAVEVHVRPLCCLLGRCSVSTCGSWSSFQVSLDC
jgi:hypothetical protein